MPQMSNGFTEDDLEDLTIVRNWYETDPEDPELPEDEDYDDETWDDWDYDDYYEDLAWYDTPYTEDDNADYYEAWVDKREWQSEDLIDD